VRLPRLGPECSTGTGNRKRGSRVSQVAYGHRPTDAALRRGTGRAGGGSIPQRRDLTFAKSSSPMVCFPARGDPVEPRSPGRGPDILPYGPTAGLANDTGEGWNSQTSVADGRPSAENTAEGPSRRFTRVWVASQPSGGSSPVSSAINPGIW